MIDVVSSHLPAALARTSTGGAGGRVHPAEEICLEPFLELQQQQVSVQLFLQARILRSGSLKSLPRLFF